MAAFGVVTVLFVAMAAFGVHTVLETTRQARLLDEAHQRVGWSQQVEQALARQMQFSVLAMLSKDEAAIARILRENNRFNELLELNFKFSAGRDKVACGYYSAGNAVPRETQT